MSVVNTYLHVSLVLYMWLYINMYNSGINVIAVYSYHC